MLNSPLANLITYNSPSIAADSPLEEALARLALEPAGALPVVDADRRVVGLLSRATVAEALLQPAGTGEAARCRAIDCAAGELVTLDEQESPAAAIRLILAHAHYVLPVLRDGRLIGLLSAADFLREFSYGELPAYHQPVSGSMADHTTQIAWKQSPAAALAEMEAEGLQYAAVVEGDCPLGVVARADLAFAVAQAAGEADCDLSRCIIEHIPPLHRGDPIGKAAELMAEHAAPAVPVVDRLHRLEGLCTREHVLRVIAGG